MRKSIVLAALVFSGFAAVAAAQQAQAQTYGPGMMGGGYGHGYMAAPGYGQGYGPGYGPGMMGYGDDDDRGYRRGRGYRGQNRGQRMCWNQNDSDRGYGYYAPCKN